MYEVGFYLFIPFLALLLLGVPIAFALGIGCFAFILLAGTPIPPAMILTEMSAALDSYALLALPTFIMTGEILNRCGMTERLIRLAMSLVGWIRGGLAHVTIVTGMLLACISGSAIADAATLGPLMIPSMIRERYRPSFAAAVTGASAVIGAILPPSVPLIIIGGQLRISVGGLFVAGILPGVLTGLALMLTAWVISRRNGYGKLRPFNGFGVAARDTLAASPVLLIPVIIVGGILGGVFTPTEAGAIAVLYAAVVGSVYYRALSWGALWESFRTTTRVSATALLIVAVSLVFGRILAYQRVPEQLLAVVLAITDSRLLLVLILVAFFLFVGTFMDAVANMIILGPLLMPLAVDGIGMHPFQYGMFLMYALLLGVLTPPLGLVLFIVAPIAKVSMEAVSVAILPFLAAMLVVLGMIAFVPLITTAIPFWAGYG